MAEQKNPNCVISIFRFRMRNLSAAERDEYNTTAERMLRIVNAMPGFISFREYKNRDVELLGITEWASAEALAEWRENPEHRKAQERGRQAFYAEFEITVCATLHQ
ncbi:MAG: antibiotic biosynthesis monooxygenase family protein, partial [Candidatus Binataceae bacterium]